MGNASVFFSSGATCSGADLTGANTESPLASPFMLVPTRVQAVAPPAISGGTLLVLPDNRTAVAADPDRDQIYIVDLVARRVTATLKLDPGDEPGRGVVDSRGRVHVALRGGGALVTIDPATGTLIERRLVCAGPRGLAHEPRTDLIHVACTDGELVSLPASGGDPVRTLRLDRDLRDVVLLGDELHVSRFRSAEVIVVSASGVVGRGTSPGTFRSAATRGGQLFTSSLAWRLVGIPGGDLAMVHQRGVSEEVQLGGVGSYGGGDPCNAIVHAAVTVMRADGSIVPGGALAGFPLAVDVDISSDGKRAALVSAGNGHSFSGKADGGATSLQVIELDSLSREVMNCRDESNRPPCVDLAPGGDGAARCAAIVPEVVGEAIAVAFTPAGVVVVQSREPAVLNVPGGPPIQLSAVSRDDTGHFIFHANAGTGLACASCHAEGSEDGRVWNFGCAGIRRTQSLQTGIRGTEPLHWDGGEKNFTQLMQDVFTRNMAGPALQAQQQDTVLSWLDNQPRPPLVEPADARAVERGSAIFHSATGAGCAVCHSGPHLTNHQTMDVGTDGLFQVPSLIGVANHPPYMHNGCAQTLRQRFSPECGGGDKHGKTSDLGPTELSDLLAYLETL